MSSADQDAWIEIAQAIRAGIRKQAELIPAMKQEELKTFVEAAQAALSLEEFANVFDKEVELRLARTSFDFW